MDDIKIVSGFGKSVSAQEYVLVGRPGTTLAMLSANVRFEILETRSRRFIHEHPTR
jgi:hypothetical protein